ncbi:asparagine synthase-domain-containing protein [Mycena pura]|uniref:Asparagine synthase-domain-containing protein n=1 Tax=Mycena pura TaxID=153505 RepID=A0AAD7E3R5_9AGAR|nr:asparagine synthase-domain-containing protein [Mycena pura]
MCGIFFCARHVKDDSADLSDICERLKHVNGARGPDSQQTRLVSLTGSNGSNHAVLLDLFASELRLRGSDPVVQPHEQSGDVFCWNGEIFDGMGIAMDENDGVKLFQDLRALDAVEQVCVVITSQATTQRIFFARDPLGRRSLLIHKPSPSNPYFLLASVSLGPDPRYEFQELSTEYVFCIELGKLLNGTDIASTFDSCMTSFPRSAVVNAPYNQLGRINTTVPPDDLPLITGVEIPPHLEPVVEDFIAHLDRSVGLRVCSIPQPHPGAARVAVLFSGGIDSTVLAFLAHKHTPLDEPIDLLNVAFENPRKMNNKGAVQKKVKNEKPAANAPLLYMVPDRVTGLQELEELRRLCPRKWNFVEVNVPYEESQAAHPLVESLMFPGRTVMDLSLAIALYFASKGEGVVRDHPNCEPVAYTSPARVLLNGVGADELLGGYSRHRSAYGTGGWQAVIDELQLDIDRIPSRNLGRDDRVISSHGKETRHPFLSLTLVAFLAALPIHTKLDLRADAGVGDKALLRLAARKMGLVDASTRKKRAMQFGSHSARMEGEKRGDILI